MKLYISADIEGVAGIVDWEQCGPHGGSAWEEGRELLTNEVNAAIIGAFEGGATQIVVNDSHGAMRTILPRLLDERVRLVQGRFKAQYMLECLDESFDGAFFIGYHGRAGARQGVLNHTYSPYETRINGEAVGETELNALVAGLAYNVPVALVTGDEWTVKEAKRVLGSGLISVVTKRSMGRYSAISLHPEEACRRIEAAAREAMIRIGTLLPYGMVENLSLEIDLHTSSEADRASLMPQVERIGDRTVRYSNNSILMIYQAYQALMILARSGEVRN